MPNTLRSLASGMILMLAVMAGSIAPTIAQTKTSFTVGYVIYVGFMPYAWMEQSGILDKWADKYGIEINLVQINDYIGGANQFIAGELDAYAMAGMDVLTMPSAGGIDTSVFLINDYSNGNDAIVSKTANSVAELAGEEVYLLQYSVSHYLLNRALVLAGLSGAGETVTTNISDTEIGAAYITQPAIEHVASWKPMVPEMLEQVPRSQIIFDSSEIPGEIMDVLVARTDLLAENPDFAKAMTGAWYEAMARLQAGGEDVEEMITVMAAAMGTDEAGFLAQIETTHFFYEPSEAAAFLEAPETLEIWDFIRIFSFEQGLFGQGATSVDSIGIAFPDESILGDPENVLLRIDSSFAEMAADGEL